MSAVKDLPAGLMESLANEIQLTTEYCSYIYRDALMRLMVSLQENSLPSAFMPVRRRVLALLRVERRAAKHFNLVWLDLNSSEQQQEEYVLKRGQLKKSVQRVLYPNLRTKQLFRMQRHLGAMIAAAMAAVWAVGAQIIIWTQLSFQGYAELRSFLGLGGFLAITALVMAYVLKDRIKEVGRTYFRGGFLRRIPDSSERITYGGRHGEIDLGGVKEFADIVPDSRLPREILAIARRHGLENTEHKVIHYRKLISLDGTVISGMKGVTRGIHDVLRYDISWFLPRLDEPLANHRVFAQDGRVYDVLMPKVYTFDVAFRYSQKLRAGLQSTHIQYVRLFFDKSGLKRCETLA